MKPQNKGKPVVLFCDGASRGNPGPGAFGYVILKDDDILFQEGKCIGTVTNNIAEYQGLLHGLKKCLELGLDHVTVKSDSQLMVRQLNGEYKVKAPQLIPLFFEAQSLLEKFQRVKVVHVRREENTLADAMCNEALDNA